MSALEPAELLALHAVVRAFDEEIAKLECAGVSGSVPSKFGDIRAPLARLLHEEVGPSPDPKPKPRKGSDRWYDAPAQWQDNGTLADGIGAVYPVAVPKVQTGAALTVLDLPARVINLLLRAGIVTVDALGVLTDDELRAIPDVGPLSIRAIRREVPAPAPEATGPRASLTTAEAGAIGAAVTVLSREAGALPPDSPVRDWLTRIYEPLATYVPAPHSMLSPDDDAGRLHAARIEVMRGYERAVEILRPGATRGPHADLGWYETSLCDAREVAGLRPFHAIEEGEA